MAGFLDRVYSARDAASTRTLYDDWAARHDAEIGDNGYATPDRCAEALKQFTPDLTHPILDFGCGTGLSGISLKQVGFETIDGVDLSAEMLQSADGKAVYRALSQIEPNAELPFDEGAYASIAAIGVIGAGAAPISVFHMLMQKLPTGGKLVFSFNDHALDDPTYEGGLAEWTDTGAARLLFKEHGDHLPGIGLGSNVYVLERL